jgi:hypothetical protein
MKQSGSATFRKIRRRLPFLADFLKNILTGGTYAAERRVGGEWGEEEEEEEEEFIRIQRIL